MPKVSVIIPNYNHAAYLDKRIQTVLNQTYQDYELILLDDNSPDSSREIMENYVRKNPEIRFFPNRVNSGSPFAQWNKGVELSKGEYIWIAESDDFCEPDLLEKLIPILDQNPHVGIAYAQSYLVDEKGSIISSYLKNLEFIYKTNTWENSFIKNGKEACREWLLFNNPIPNASGALIRKEAFAMAGMANPDMRLNGDWYLYAKVLVNWDLAFCAEHLNYFRVHQHTQRERERSSYKVYNDIVAVNRYIRNHIDGAEQNADKALSKVASWWAANLPYQKWNRHTWKGNWYLYKTFRKHRERLILRVFYSFGFVYLRKMLIRLGILRAAKKVRRAIFPGKYFDQ